LHHYSHLQSHHQSPLVAPSVTLSVTHSTVDHTAPVHKLLFLVGDTQPVKSWFSKVFGALSGPPSTVDTNPKSVLHRSAKRHKSPADDPKLTTRSRCIVGDSRRSSPLSSRQLKALHLDPHLSSPGRSGSSSATCEQGSARVTKRSTQLTADYLKRRLDRKARHKTGLTNHRRGFHTSPCEEMKENR